MPRAFELHQRMGIDADEPRAEILHEETPKPQNHQHPEQDVQADRRRGLAPAVGDDGAPASAGHAEQFCFLIEQRAGEAAPAEGDVGAYGFVGPGKTHLQDDFGGKPQQHGIAQRHDDGEDRAAEGDVDAVHGHGVQDQMLAFRRHGRGDAERGLKRERQQHGPHGVAVQRAADVVGDAGIRVGDEPGQPYPCREAGDGMVDDDHDAAHVAGRPEAEPHEREPQVHEAAPEDQQAGTAPLAVHFVNPKQHYQQAGDENSHL